MAPALFTDLEPPGSARSNPAPPPALVSDGDLVMEHAKGALMLRYGIDSCQALAVMVRWSRDSGTSLPQVAHTLVHGICEGNPQTAARQRPLMKWLEHELRHHDLDLVRATSPPATARDH